MQITFKQKFNGKVKTFTGKIIADNKYDMTVLVESNDFAIGFHLFNVRKI
jgi:nicotinamide riboside kinase